MTPPPRPGKRMLNADGSSRVTLITGAGSKRGFGRTSAVLLAAHGAKVVVTDLASFAEQGRQVVAEIRADGGEAEWYPLDVTKESDWKAAVEFTEKTFGPLDVLVNNAGYAQEYFRYAAPHDAELDGLYKHPTADWKKQIAVNQEGVYFGMREGSGSMVKNKKLDGKSIINVSSAAALQGGGSGIGYNASKWAVRGMTKHAALFLAHRNIRVNSVHPGFFATDIHDYILANPNLPKASIEKFVQRTSSGSPLMRGGDPMEIAYAILYLASTESSYTTGVEIVVDGGSSTVMGHSENRFLGGNKL